MVIMISRAGSTPRWRLLIVALALPSEVRPADWTVLPSLRLRESYTDNLHLSPAAQAQGELVTEVSPGLSVSAQGPRLKLALDYTLQSLHSSREPSRRSQQLAAATHLAAVPDWFYLDARANISQQNISAFGPQLPAPLLASANTTTVRTTAFSPYLQHEFQGLATLLARFDSSSVSSGHLLSVRSNDALIQLTGDNAGRGLNWALRLSRQQIDDARLPAATLQDSALTLSYPLKRQWTASATAGCERNNYQTLGDQPQGKYWSIASEWTPSPRTSVSATLGRHYYGATYGLNASLRQRRMLWTLNYNVAITSTNGQFLSVPPGTIEDFLFQLWEARIPEPATRRQIVRAFIALSQLLGPQGNVNYFSHRYYLQKQWQAATLYSGALATWSLGLNSTGRRAQSDSAIDSELIIGPTDLTLQDHTRQTTLQAGSSWRLNGRSQLTLSASSGVSESLSTGRRDRNSALVLSLSHQLHARMNLSTDIRHSRHSSNAGGNYRENGVSATLSMQF